jgi:hypothetical protein
MVDWSKNDVAAPVSGAWAGLTKPAPLLQSPWPQLGAQGLGAPKQEPAPAAAAGDDPETQRRRRMLVEMLGRPVAHGPDGPWALVGGIANGLLNAAQHLQGGRGGMATTTFGAMPGSGSGGG